MTPENRLKILDFGLAMRLGAAGEALLAESAALKSAFAHMDVWDNRIRPQLDRSR